MMQYLVYVKLISVFNGTSTPYVLSNSKIRFICTHLPKPPLCAGCETQWIFKQNVTKWASPCWSNNEKLEPQSTGDKFSSNTKYSFLIHCFSYVCTLNQIIIWSVKKTSPLKCSPNLLICQAMDDWSINAHEFLLKWKPDNFNIFAILLCIKNCCCYISCFLS